MGHNIERAQALQEDIAYLRGGLPYNTTPLRLKPFKAARSSSGQYYWGGSLATCKSQNFWLTQVWTLIWSCTGRPWGSQDPYINGSLDPDLQQAKEIKWPVWGNQVLTVMRKNACYPLCWRNNRLSWRESSLFKLTANEQSRVPEVLGQKTCSIKTL